MFVRPAALALLALAVACNGEDTDGPPVDTDTDTDTDGPPGVMALAPAGPQTLNIDQEVTYTLSGIDPDQAYRITLVAGPQITAAGDGTATFQDNDANGYADAGPSEYTALITNVNYGAIPPAKTVPAPTDNPASPTGIYDFDGEITFTVRGIAGGTVYPVMYHNGGVTTFLEVTGGAATETYLVGGGITVNGPRRPIVAPPVSPTIPVAGTTALTISNLDDTQAYRVTLVVGDYLDATPPNATFQDDDANGYADAGASELIANITAVNGSPVPGAKTVPAPTDDPAAPTGVFPTGGSITLEITGIGAGTVYPVVYHNGGTTTFLEVEGGTYAPTEVYSVGASITVTP